ncbi:twin-arginine translocase TatA/TatE family subunit [Microbacterium lushaniae]|uniref:twin-arginine translocase TatA/TatE family subunit n=1 Tax=Microbacterium lushaniae TaxID=2614639 RepID=UPI001CD68B85|nr:twin-arginine translocase TatA/TatE family subunit [Microbacterium lushaniae]
MLGNAFGPWHLLIILAVILLLFGAAKLPALAKSMGQSARVFRGEIKAMKQEDTTETAPADRPDARTSANTVADRPGGTPDSTP